MERTNQGTICVFVDVYLVYVVAIHWWIQGRGPEGPLRGGGRAAPLRPPPPLLFLDQTEAQMVETIFFGHRSSPVSVCVKLHEIRVE